MATTGLREPLTDDRSIHDAIARRARERWQERGCVDGHTEEDWAQAESEIHSQLAAGKACTRRLVVKADNLFYIAEYDSSAAASYDPGELQRGEQVQLHFEGEKMWLKLPGGRELETRIIRKETR